MVKAHNAKPPAESKVEPEEVDLTKFLWERDLSPALVADVKALLRDFLTAEVYSGESFTVTDKLRDHYAKFARRDRKSVV